MKNLKLAIWIILLWLLQVGFSKTLRIGGIAPYLLYDFVLCMALLEKKPSYYIGICIICGLLADVSAGEIPGFYLLTFTCSTFLLVGLVNLIYKEIFLMIIPVALLLIFASESVYYLIHHSVLGSISYWTAIKSIILPGMIYNTIVCLIFNPILKKTVYQPHPLRRKRAR